MFNRQSNNAVSKRTASVSPNSARTQSSAEERASIIIQTSYRRHRDQHKYGIKQFKRAEQSQSLTFSVGNDPVIDQLHLHKPISSQATALVATSGMRAIKIACELKNGGATPKVIIVDNSYEVSLFWNEFRDAFRQESVEDNLYKRLKRLFIDEAIIRVFHGEDIDNNRSFDYLNELVRAYGFATIKRVVLNTIFIKQSWATPGLFLKIKNILAHNGITNIYAYPSNILACMDGRGQDNQITHMLNNIVDLNPRLSIHTDVCPIHGVPEKVFYVTDQTPANVRRQIFASDRSMDNSSQIENLMLLSMLFGNGDCFASSSIQELMLLSALSRGTGGIFILSPNSSTLFGSSRSTSTTTASAAAAAAAATTDAAPDFNERRSPGM